MLERTTPTDSKMARKNECARMEDSRELENITRSAICSSDLRPTCCTGHQLIASYAPYQEQAVRATAVACLPTHPQYVGAKIADDGSS